MRVATLVIPVLLAAGFYAGFVSPLEPPASGPADGRQDFAFYQRRPWFDEPGAAGSLLQSRKGEFPLEGMVGLVTGSSSGIGRAVAQYLHSKGCTVLVVSRSEKRSKQACVYIEERTQGSPGRCDPYALDLSSLQAVRDFTSNMLREYDRLDFLNANAGMTFLVSHDGAWLSTDGYEMLYASNYLGHFLLAQLLLPLLKKSNGRIAATSSIAHWYHDTDLETLLPSAMQNRSDKDLGSFAKMRQYGNTKLLQVFMCFEMQRREPQVPCTPVAPGFISTAILKPYSERDGVDGWFPVFAQPSEEGAKTELQALLADEGLETGVFLQPYYAPPYRSPPASGMFMMVYEFLGQLFTWGCHRWIAHPDAYDKAFAKKVWDESMAAVGLSK